MLNVYSIYMSLFMAIRVPPESSLNLLIPEHQENNDPENKIFEDIHYKGGVFPQLSHFLYILHEVTLLYARKDKLSAG